MLKITLTNQITGRTEEFKSRMMIFDTKTITLMDDMIDIEIKGQSLRVDDSYYDMMTVEEF